MGIFNMKQLKKPPKTIEIKKENLNQLCKSLIERPKESFIFLTKINISESQIHLSNTIYHPLFTINTFAITEE